MELDSTDTLCNSAVSTIFVRSKSIEFSGNDGIPPVWILWFTHVSFEGLAWVLAWDQIMEDAETISAAGVDDVVAELAELGMLRANVSIEGRSNRSVL